MSDLAVVITWSTDPVGPGLIEAIRQAEAEVAIAVIGPPTMTLPPGADRLIRSEHPASSAAVLEALRWFGGTGSHQLLWAERPDLDLSPTGLRRLRSGLADSGAPFIYADYLERAGAQVRPHPLIDWQPGALRDDFDFGPLLFLHGGGLLALAGAIEDEGAALRHAGFYDLRLRLSETGSPLRLAEPVCTLPPPAAAAGEAAHFAYVDPRNRGRQLEMEQVCTEHLKRIGAFLPPPTGPLVVEQQPFPVEASVIIPVRNRARTIAEAVDSALAQQAPFDFNVIVIDNRSDDGTSQILAARAQADRRLVHLIPKRTDLGIGGCWNEAVYASACGRYAIQLDSDDLYAGPATLARMVDAFREKPCAMVVGAYTIVDFDLREQPPGLIDHREWTDANGHNNALRIHGLGAPRGFHVPTLRHVGFPNVSYGEDYAVALRLSRSHPVGRIYDSLYWCRRWEDNSDHGLDLETANRYATYKDRLRTVEILARQRSNAESP